MASCGGGDALAASPNCRQLLRLPHQRSRAPESRAPESRAPESRAPESCTPESRAPGSRFGQSTRVLCNDAPFRALPTPIRAENTDKTPGQSSPAVCVANLPAQNGV